MATKASRARPGAGSGVNKPGHVGDLRILQSSRTRGQDIRVRRPIRYEAAPSVQVGSRRGGRAAKPAAKILPK